MKATSRLVAVFAGAGAVMLLSVPAAGAVARLAHPSGTGFPCYVSNTMTMTNSLCGADGSSSYALVSFANGGTTTLRNDTLEAPGNGGVALWATATTGHSVAATLSDAIARGAMVDMLAQTDSTSPSSATITADHSNYA